MKAVLKNQLQKPFDNVISYSWISPLVGAFVIIPWGYFVFTWMEEELPRFIFIVNIVFWCLFVFILLRQIKETFSAKKFLLATKGSLLFLPFNHVIKKADKDKDYFLELDLAQDVNNVLLVKETRYTPYKRGSKSGTQIKKSVYIEFELKEKPSENILQALKDVLSDEGFQGSPILFKQNYLQFYLDGNTSKLKQVQEVLKKAGIYSGRVTLRKFKSDGKVTKQQILDELERIESLGERILGQDFLKALRAKEVISEQEYLDLTKISKRKLK